MPSRFASKGLLNCFDKSKSEPKPFKVILERLSAPQTIAKSKSPQAMAQAAASSAIDELEHAVENAQHSPEAPVLFATNSAKVLHS